MKRGKGDDEEQARCTVVLQYDLTPQLAEAIGGDAPALQAMLANGGGKPMKVTRSGVVLDTKEVGIKFKGADGEELTIDRTSRLKAKARQPNAEDTGPTLEAAASFAIEDDEPLAFLRTNLGQLVKCRLDKRQLELVTEEEAVEDAKA
jgi:hypothetical protein